MHRNLAPDLSQWLVQALARLIATFAIVQGLGIIVGGADRWRGPGFAVALTVPGAPATWGWALFLLGALALWGTFTTHRRLTWVALAGLGVWSLFFAISFLVVVLTIPGSATTGIFTYGFVAANAFVLAQGYRSSRA